MEPALPATGDQAPGLFLVQQRSRRNPYGVKANRLCLGEASERSALKSTVKSSNILPSAGHDDDTFALMPSLLQGSTSIHTLSF